MRGTQVAAESRSTRRAGIESIAPETLQGLNVVDRLSQAGDRYSEHKFTGHPPLTPVYSENPVPPSGVFCFRVFIFSLYLSPAANIFRRMKAICVCSGNSFGQKSLQPKSDMQPNTPSSLPTSS